MPRRSTATNGHYRGLLGGVLAIGVGSISGAVLAQSTAVQTASLQASGRPLQISLDAQVTVRLDRSVRARQTVRTKIESERGAARASSISLSYLPGAETLVLDEAYIERADGSRTPTDPATVEIRRAPAPSAVDQMVLHVSFPQPAVGDTLVYQTTRDSRGIPFAGHFSHSAIFQRSEPWARARHVVAVPRDMAVSVDVADTTGSLAHVRAEEADGSIVHTFVFDPKTPLDGPDEPGAIASSDRDPHFTLTSFADPEAFAAAYWAGARDAALPTAELTTLARAVTRDLGTAREKAVAIDRWLKRTVRYQAMPLGRHAWVPQAASAVLASGQGDSKDVVALASALLASVGVETEHVLVNLGQSYALARLPPASFNHVMLHVPEADLFLDPAAVFALPGVLSLQAYDKPTLHAGPQGARLGRTPAMRPDEHTTQAVTSITVADNGAIEGETTQTSTGIFAASARAAMLRFQADGVEAAAAQRLSALGTPGSGSFTARSPSELREPFVVQSRFAIAVAAELPLAGNRRMPVGLPIHARPGQFLFGPRLVERRHPFVCFAGVQSEEIAVTFAANHVLPRVPLGKSIGGRWFSYDVSYTLEGRTFRVKRIFTSRVPGQVCNASLEAELADPMKDIVASLGTMLVFPGSAAAKKR